MNTLSLLVEESEIASTSVKVYKFAIRTLPSVEYNIYDIRRQHKGEAEWNSSFGVTCV